METIKLKPGIIQVLITGRECSISHANSVSSVKPLLSFHLDAAIAAAVIIQQYFIPDAITIYSDFQLTNSHFSAEMLACGSSLF